MKILNLKSTKNMGCLLFVIDYDTDLIAKNI